MNSMSAMNSMTDADIHAFGAPPPSGGGRPTPERAGLGHQRAARGRVWPWVVLALAALFVGAVVAGVLVLAGTLEQALDLAGFDIRIDGERVFSLPRHEAAWWAVAAALAAAMVVLVVVPLSLLLALVITALALAAAVVVVLGVAALVLSPLWGLALLLWLALRPSRQGGGHGAPAPSMAAASQA